MHGDNKFMQFGWQTSKEEAAPESRWEDDIKMDSKKIIMEKLIRLNRLEVESSGRFSCDCNVSSNFIIIPGQLDPHNSFRSEMFVNT
jgi:hypothetical protein